MKITANNEILYILTHASKKDLVEMCAGEGLPTKGMKKDLVAKLSTMGYNYFHYSSAKGRLVPAKV